ncbi:hypothetical protein [Pseudoalteromonas umbrosa]|uniref:hypothetical protein n=1 Tax=Pseudoalteromonas umbrosa TaxID=3048489 RepID=UPI0024C21C9E|nr:hypothetical protein [Pseudoalteromonas sp. B95]MDK1285981.1 hypothetical protein [Pseudoalteromonas sp. B95]
MMNTHNTAHCATRWDTRLFLIAGCCMLINTVCLWMRHFSGYQMSLLWAAVPAIIALGSCTLGVLKLYPRAVSQARKLAISGACFAVMSLTSLVLASMWIFVLSVFGDGISGRPSTGFAVLIGAFMVFMMISFAFNSVSFLVERTTRNIGLLLLVPVSCWALMLIVALLKSFEAGLSLDFYTNGVMGVAFLLVAFVLKKRQ